MADYQLLHKKKHANLRVAARYTAELGCNIGAVMVVDTELRAAQREYPIIFRKHPETGRFFPNALLGFKENENLFLDGEGNWGARHVPFTVAKGPFIVGVDDPGNVSQPMTCIDMADPRVSEGGEGEALFQEDGRPTRYMDHINNVLSHLHYSAVTQMADLFVELDLIEPLRLDIQFENRERLRFEGGYIITEEKLAALDEKALKNLHESGFLAAAYYISSSVDNVQNLINIKNRQLAASRGTGNG